jgi:hypothetical protein
MMTFLIFNDKYNLYIRMIYIYCKYIYTIAIAGTNANFFIIKIINCIKFILKSRNYILSLIIPPFNFFT